MATVRLTNTLLNFSSRSLQLIKVIKVIKHHSVAVVTSDIKKESPKLCIFWKMFLQSVAKAE